MAAFSLLSLLFKTSAIAPTPNRRELCPNAFCQIQKDPGLLPKLKLIKIDHASGVYYELPTQELSRCGPGPWGACLKARAPTPCRGPEAKRVMTMVPPSTKVKRCSCLQVP